MATLIVNPTMIDVEDEEQNTVTVNFTCDETLSDIKLSMDNGITYKNKITMTQTSAMFDITGMDNYNYDCKLKGYYEDTPTNIPVTSVSLEPKTHTFSEINSTLQLIATVLPVTATNKHVTWSSSDPTVATVNTNGLVTSKKNGSTTITVMTTDGAKTSTCNIVVNEEVLPTYELSVVPGNYTGAKNGIAYISGICTYPNVHYFEVTSDDGWVGVANIFRNGKFELELNYLLQIKTYRNCVLEARTKDDEVIAIANGKFDLTVTEEGSVNIPTTGIEVEPTSATIDVGDTVQLNASIVPSNATNQDVTWQSFNNSIATVNQNGLVTGVGKGSVWIRCSQGSIIADANITVNETQIDPDRVHSVKLNKNTLTLEMGKNETLVATITPSTAINKELTWRSSNTAVALFVEGYITPKSVGTCNLTVTSKDGNKTDTCVLTVTDSGSPNVPVTGISISNPSHTFTSLNTKQLSCTIAPSHATNKNVTWNSSNTSVVTVSSNGLMTAKANGNATVTVRTVDGNKTATCSVVVNVPTPPPPSGDLVEGKMYRSIAFIPYPHESGWGAYDGLDQFKAYNYGSALICLPVDCSFSNNNPFCDVTEALLNSVCNKAEGLGLQPILKMHTVSLQEDGQGNVDKPTNAQTWFNNYRTLVNKYADMVVRRGYKEFIISNEMHNVMNLASNKQYMTPIINDVKAKGLKVSMSMNTPEVIENDGFQYFDELDFYCMNTYPSLTHNQYSNEWARNNFETLRNGFYTVENYLDIDYATLFKNMGGSNNLHKEIWLTEVGANTSNKTLEYPAYWGDSTDPKTNYEGQKHWLHAVFDVLEKDRQTGKLPARVSRYMLWDGNYGSNFNPIGKMGQEVLDTYWKDEVDPPPPTPGEINYFDISNTLWEENECTHTINTSNKTITVSSDRNTHKYYGYLVWDISKIREGRRYRFTCKSSNSMSFIRFRVDGERIADVGFKNEYTMEFTGVNAQEKLVDICLGIRQPQNENIGLITTTFSDIKLIDLDGEPEPLPESDVKYDVVDYKIIVKQNGITESYHSCEDIPRNLNGNGGIDGYKLIIKDRIKHYLSLTKGASNSRITIDGMKPFNYTYIDQAWKAKWIGVGYSIYHNTLNFTIANRVDKGEWGDVEDRTINPVSLEKGIRIFNCALPGYMKVTHDQNSPNSVSEGYFETTWLGICRLNHYKGEKFHIHQNIKLLGGFGNSTRFYVSVLVHELGHVTGIPDNSPHYPTSYLYDKEDREPEWLQPSDIAHIQDKFPHLTGKSTEMPTDFYKGVNKNVLFSFVGYKNEDDMLKDADTVIDAKFVNKEDEGLYIYGLDYNLYNFEVTKTIKGNRKVKEIVQIKEHESFDLGLEAEKEYKLYLADYEKTQSCLLNPSQTIIKL